MRSFATEKGSASTSSDRGSSNPCGGWQAIQPGWAPTPPPSPHNIYNVCVWMRLSLHRRPVWACMAGCRMSTPHCNMNGTQPRSMKGTPLAA